MGGHRTYPQFDEVKHDCTPEEHIAIMRDLISELKKHADALCKDNWNVSFIVGNGGETLYRYSQLRNVHAETTVKL